MSPTALADSTLVISLPALTAWIGFGAIVAQIFASIKLGVEALVSGQSKYETWDLRIAGEDEVAEVFGKVSSE